MRSDIKTISREFKGETLSMPMQNDINDKVTLDEFILWVETNYEEAYSFLGLIKYWRNKHYAENTTE